MTIDIDSFLDKYNKEKNPNSDKEEKIEKINLEFQKDIEDKLLKAENKIKEDSGFELLERVYDEIKKFDEDIPSKFVGMENKGNLALKDIGEKYSEGFLSQVKQNVSIAHQNIAEHMKILDSKINTEEFSTIVKEFEILVRLIEIYPKEFLTEKMMLTEEIRKREIIINTKINQYKLVKLKIIKNDINNAILELNKSLKPENIAEIEGRISHLKLILRSIPKIFLTETSNEKILISKILIKSEKYLENEYIKEYNKRENNLNILFEAFHTSYINKDLQKTLILYDEILLEFQSVPEVFFEKKIAIYKKTNELYAMINDLFLKNNLSMLMQSYNTGQIIKEARDYIKHAKATSKINYDTLSIIKQKISMLTDKAEPEKTNILREIQTISSKYKNSPNSEENIQNETKINTFTQYDSEIEIENTPIKLHKESNFTSQLYEEINFHYEKIKKSNNPQELKILYKKIMFYLSTVQIEQSKKNEIIKKINKTLSEKKFN